jgi:uncharacterized protein (DUF1330 family)
VAAYCIGQIRVKDAVAWEAYRSRVSETIAQYGGEVLFRGAVAGTFNGSADHGKVVALKFDDLAAAKRWHDSAEYQALIALRDQGAEVSLVLYQE